MHKGKSTAIKIQEAHSQIRIRNVICKAVSGSMNYIQSKVLGIQCYLAEIKLTLDFSPAAEQN